MCLPILIHPITRARHIRWQLSDCYRSPGPIQYTGAYAHEVNLTLQYECLPESEVREGAGSTSIESVPQNPPGAFTEN